MKNIYKYLFAIMALGLCYSCEDELELFPEDAIATELGFSNVNDFEAAAKGIYSGFRRSGYYGATSGAASIYFIPDVMSDDVIINANGRRSRETYYDWRHAEDFSSEAFWLSAYKVIQRANLMLENISVLDGNPLQNSYQAEALAARAIAHFDLAKLYAGSPANTADSELGIPYVRSTESNLQPARNTLGETYAAILEDLTMAKSLMDADSGRGRINSNTISAIMSRIHLYRGDYQSCISAANDVVGVQEASITEFPNIWKDATDNSVIWKIVVTEPDDVTLGVAWLQESPDGIRSEYNVDLELFNLYADNDVRKATYFETSPFNGVDYNHIVKYRGRLTGNANEVDAKCIRYAEVLLNKAEAYAETNQDGQALAALDELRANRYDGFVSGGESGQALKDAIALERRLELAFEGQRFFDLKRKGLSVTRSVFGDEADGGGIPARENTLPAGDHRFNMAIGEGEIDANPNMVQNSGY